MRKIFVLLYIISLVSCKLHDLKDKLNKDNLEVYFKSKLKEIDNTATLQKIEVLNIDTLSESEIFYHYSRLIGSQFEEMKEKGKNLLDKYEYHLRMRNLSSGISKELYNDHQNEADNTLKEIKELSRQDSLMANDIKSLLKIAETKDRINPVFYEVKFLFEYDRMNKSVVTDTGYVKLNKQFKIVDLADYIEYLKRSYQPKSDFKIK